MDEQQEVHWLLCDVCGDPIEVCHEELCIHEEDHYYGTACFECADEALSVED